MYWVETWTEAVSRDGLFSPVHLEGCEWAEMPEGAAKWDISIEWAAINDPDFKPIIKCRSLCQQWPVIISEELQDK